MDLVRTLNSDADALAQTRTFLSQWHLEEVARPGGGYLTYRIVTADAESAARQQEILEAWLEGTPLSVASRDGFPVRQRKTQKTLLLAFILSRFYGFRIRTNNRHMDYHLDKLLTFQRSLIPYDPKHIPKM